MHQTSTAAGTLNPSPRLRLGPDTIGLKEAELNAEERHLANFVDFEGKVLYHEWQEIPVNDRIQIDPKIRHGKPVIRGTRVPVHRLIRSL